MNTFLVRGLMIFSLLTATFFAGCGSSNSTEAKIAIPVFFPFTGDFASAASGLELPFELAVETINQAGGIRGQLVVAKFIDTESDPDVARARAEEEMANGDVSALFGGLLYSVEENLFEVAVDHEALLIVNMNDFGSPRYFSSPEAAENNDLFLRTIPDFSGEVQLLVDRWNKRGEESIVHIVRPLEGWLILDQVLQKTCESRGCTIKRVLVQESAPVVEVLVRKVLAMKPDAIKLSFDQDTGLEILRELYLQGWKKDVNAAITIARLRADHLLDDGLSEKIYTALSLSNSTYINDLHRRGTAAYADRWLTAVYAAGGYDAFILLSLALQTADARDARAIASTMRTMSAEPGTEIGPFDYPLALELIAEGKPIHYRGAIGLRGFDSFGEADSEVVPTLVKFIDGQPVPYLD